MSRLGVLVPSSNLVLEPLAALLSAGRLDFSVHFSRLGVLDVRLNATSLAQFEITRQVEAAKLLCDAHVDHIVWGGTSASWLGVDHDKRFVERLVNETGTPATTCVLEINRKLAEIGASRIGIVTPYTSDVADQINENYESMGFVIAASAHHGGEISNDFAHLGEDVIEQMIREVSSTGVDAVVIMCTNVAGAAVADRLQEQLAVPIIDSAAATLFDPSDKRLSQ